MAPAEIQDVYDEAYAQGILEYPKRFDPSERATKAWIENDELHVLIAPSNTRSV